MWSKSIWAEGRRSARVALHHDTAWHDRLSVNVNKVATLRNSRGGAVPSVLEAVDVCIAAGAPGITVHPRADRRHITPDDVRAIARAAARASAERRVQHRRRSAPGAAGSRRRGPARPVHARARRAGRGHQPGRLAARAGHRARCLESIARLRTRGVRVSLFVDASPEPIRWAAVGRRRPRRAVHRAVRARVRARARSAAAARSSHSRRPRGWRTRSGWASTPATISISTTWCCSASCRSSTRCRSATPSSRARCSSVWRPWSASICDVLSRCDMIASACSYQPSAGALTELILITDS